MVYFCIVLFQETAVAEEGIGVRFLTTELDI